jgi:hypothetical protein
MIKKSFKLFLRFLPKALIITLFAGLVFAALQQSLRQGANDPQIQIAEDMASLLSGGFPATSLISTGLPVEISTSLGAYAMIFNETGKLTLTSGKLHGKNPELPAGIFDYTKNHTEDRITWQPEPGVRSALVIVHYTGTASGYVAVGRSLREVEKREDQLKSQTLVVWLSSLLIALFAVILT